MAAARIHRVESRPHRSTINDLVATLYVLLVISADSDQGAVKNSRKTDAST